MLVVLLILLLIAAMTGVLGAVLEVTLVIVLSLVLSIVLVWIGSWYAKRRFREFQRQFDTRTEQDRRRRSAYDVGPGPTKAPAPGDGR